jgi:dTDP-4-dehydrorhamnose reductase
MKILILGGDGMLGHQLLNSFKEKFEVKVTLRKNINEYTKYKIFTHDNCFDHVDVRDFGKLASVIEEFKKFRELYNLWRPDMKVNIYFSTNNNELIKVK